jgi:predicted nucleic acid-binding protein
VPNLWNVFLDTSVLFAAVLSESGGARLIFKLGEAGAIALWVSPWVLSEAEAVIQRKSPASRPLLALLLHQAQVQVAPPASQAHLQTALGAVSYRPDAQVLAEALAASAQYFVSLDRQHLVGNPHLAGFAYPVGTPGDFLAWYRAQSVRPPCP